MTRNYLSIGVRIAIVAAALGALALMCLSKPQIARDPDGPFKLCDALREIGHSLRASERNTAGERVDAEDFNPWRAAADRQRHEQDGRLRVKRHGVVAVWLSRDGALRKTLFYPIALAKEIVLEPPSGVEPTPQIVMVPVDEEDVETLPILSGCRGVAPDRMEECQRRRMKVLFSRHGIEYAATLRSDGSTLVLSVDDVCNWKR